MAAAPKKPPRTSAATAGLARRAEQLDALEAVLPFDRRDRLAGLLSDDDVATLRHLAQHGIGDNSLRALASDLFYLEAWALAATGAPLPWPAPEELLLKFVAHHLWDTEQRAFASCGRRRSEIAALSLEQLVDEAPVPLDHDGKKLQCLAIRHRPDQDHRCRPWRPGADNPSTHPSTA